jgi:transketolase
MSDGILGGHPEITIPGVEASTGSLGHGLSIGIGMALNAKLLGAGHRVFVIVGDGECNEGSIWEAALSAGKHKLDGLTVFVDYNKYQSYGSVAEVQNLEPFADKWRSFGFAATEVDGHNVDDLRSVMSGLPLESGRPSAIICHTVKGKGFSFVENNMDWHHKNRISAEEIQALLSELEVG